MRYLLGLLLIVGMASCNQKSAAIPDSFDYGTVEKDVYKNNYFEFELPVPADWNLQSKEQLERMSAEGQRLIEQESSKEFAKKIKTSEVGVAKLITIFRHPTGQQTGEFNHSLQILAENLKAAPAVKTGGDYLNESKKLMKESGMGYEFRGDNTTVNVGGREFSMMPVTLTVNGVKVRQNYYSRIENRFALCILTSFTTEEQENEIAAVLGKLKFK